MCDELKHEEMITMTARIGYECEGYLERVLRLGRNRVGG